ncbi:MAG: four helix bundle protein [Bacteroides sp.]|nr:four helix bundle protein [Bacteroides sp.]
MARNSVTLDKSKNFAIRIVRLYQYLSGEMKEYVLSKQMLRSGTSIGANLSEAIYGISEKDFLSKVYISLKECAETKYWLELLFKTDFLSEVQYRSIDDDCTELIKLLTSTAKTMSNKLKSNI